jgi:hypothetical protein
MDKKITFQNFLILLSLLMNVISLTKAQSDCPEGMIVYWKFDEVGSVNTFLDSFGAINASCSNCPDEDNGIVNRARSFNGSNEMIAPNNSVFSWDNNTSFSVEVWIKTTQQGTGNKVFVGKYRGGSNMNWWLGFGNNNKAIFEVKDSNNIIAGLEGKKEINDGDWHHVVGIRNASINVLQLFIDGVKENEVSTFFTGDFSGSDPVYIGYFINAYHYNGLLDEVAIYDTALSESQITVHYNNSLQGVDYCGRPSGITEENIFPKTYFLSQNYPNPFNPVTKIRFSIPERQQVRIKVFNQLVEEISNLVNSEYDAGSYDIEFNGGNLASGVYFYRMEAGSFSSIKKLLLLK